MRVQLLIEPDPVVKGGPVHYQRVAFPAADVMAVPGRVGVLGMAAAIQVDLVKAGAVVIGNLDEIVLALYELPDRAQAQYSGGQAARLRAILAIVVGALFGQRQRPRKEFRL